MNEASLEIIKNKKAEKVSISTVFYNFFKRSFDIVVSFISLILLSPIFLITVILIRKDSKGKAIFKQKRIGKNGNPIYIYKFRSMIVNAEEELERLMKENPEIKEEYLKNKKLKDDPRITKVGKVIRRTSIDELPQLINVLKGNMSLIGPRPWIPEYYDNMNKKQKRRVSVLPGLTGLAQVSGRNDIDVFKKIDYDLEYVDNFSFKQDISIIFKTICVIFKKDSDISEEGINREIKELEKQKN